MNDTRIIKVSEDITVEFSRLGNIRVHSAITSSYVSLDPDEVIPLSKALQLVNWRIVSGQLDAPIKSERKACHYCKGTGVADSGGFDAQDRPINIPCPYCSGATHD